MLETDGYARPEGKTIKQSATKLRFNAASLEDALQKIRDYGITAEINRHDWGATIDIFDPDGKRAGIRDETSFADQIVASRESWAWEGWGQTKNFTTIFLPPR